MNTVEGANRQTISPTQVPALARTFEVSPLALSYRLVNLGLR